MIQFPYWEQHHISWLLGELVQDSSIKEDVLTILANVLQHGITPIILSLTGSLPVFLSFCNLSYLPSLCIFIRLEFNCFQLERVKGFAVLTDLFASYPHRGNVSVILDLFQKIVQNVAFHKQESKSKYNIIIIITAIVLST